MSTEPSLDYRTHAPSAALAPFVQCYWTLSGRAADLSAAPERVLPDGRVEVVLNCGDPVWEGHAGGQLRQPPELLVGPSVAPTLLRTTGRVDMVGVRFHHEGAHAFFPELAALTGCIVPLGDAGRVFPATLREQVSEASGARARAQLVEGHLARRLSTSWRTHGARADRRVAHATSLIVTSGGTARIARVAAAVGLSARQLARRFRVEVGVGPKLLSRLTRFQRLLQLVGSERPRTLAAAAARAGYADQAHLARDFRDFAGQSASTFFGGRHTLSTFFLGLDDAD